MTNTPLVHIFRCPCGRQGRALTHQLHDCKCGISRRYYCQSGLFDESLYRTIGWPSVVIRYERQKDLFIYKPERFSEATHLEFKKTIHAAYLQEEAWFGAVREYTATSPASSATR